MYDSAISEFTSKRSLLLLGGLCLIYMVLYTLLSIGSSALTALGVSF